MKTEFSIARHSRRSRNGSAVIVILILLGILLLLLAANTRTLNWLRKEVDLAEKRQTQRLAPAATNELRATQSVTNPPPAK